MELDKKEMKI